MIESGRACGHTTRLLLQTANAMSQGKRVIVIAHTYNAGIFLRERLLQVLTVLCPDFIYRFQREHVELKNGGQVRFLPRGRISYSLRGCTYDVLLSDVGELTHDEFMEIAPCIRSESVVDIDITHFETGEDDELPVPPTHQWPFQVKSEDEESPPAVPKERTNARRVLSSR